LVGDVNTSLPGLKQLTWTVSS